MQSRQESEVDIRRQAERFGQGHLFAFWDELDAAQRKELLDQLSKIDFGLIDRLRDLSGGTEDWAELARRAQPPQAFRLAGEGNPFSAEQALHAGEEALRSGRVGAILVAGGQGSRLGFDHP